jgi:hypothetical protein
MACLQVYEEILPYASFVVRVAEADIPQLHLILQAIPTETIHAMQTEIKCLRQVYQFGLTIYLICGIMQDYAKRRRIPLDAWGSGRTAGVAPWFGG